MKTIRDDIKPYLDSDRLVAPRPTFPGQFNASGNGLLYTAEYYLLLAIQNQLTLGDLGDWLAIMKTCEVRPGLYRRSPQHPDQEGPDDYVGICAAAAALNPMTAKAIYHYGERTRAKWGPFKFRFVYNNVALGVFSKSAWLGRQPQLIAHMMHAAKMKPPLWRRIWWAVTIATSGLNHPESQDSWILSWLMVQTAAKGPIETIAARIWKRRLWKQYPRGGIAECLESYFGHLHPIAKFAPGGKYFALRGRT